MPAKPQFLLSRRERMPIKRNKVWATNIGTAIMDVKPRNPDNTTLNSALASGRPEDLCGFESMAPSIKRSSLTHLSPCNFRTRVAWLL